MLTEHEALVEHYAMALAQALYGPEFDPFTAPETYDFCVEMMGKVVPVIRTTDAARIAALESALEVLLSEARERGGGVSKGEFLGVQVLYQPGLLNTSREQNQ